MNHFYMIGEIIAISEVIIDYYNKCKMSVLITCKESRKNDFKIILQENLIDFFYSKLNPYDTIFVYGSIIGNNVGDIIAESIKILN